METMETLCLHSNQYHQIWKKGQNFMASWNNSIYLSKCHTIFLLDALIYSKTLWDEIDSQEAFSTINIQAFLFLCYFPFPFKIFLRPDDCVTTGTKNLLKQETYSNRETITSDESEPCWLKPQLELKVFQLSSALDLFHSAQN